MISPEQKNNFSAMTIIRMTTVLCFHQFCSTQQVHCTNSAIQIRQSWEIWRAAVATALTYDHILLYLRTKPVLDIGNYKQIIVWNWFLLATGSLFKRLLTIQRPSRDWNIWPSYFFRCQWSSTIILQLRCKCDGEG